MFLEYEAVLIRAEHRRVTGMNQKDIALFLDGLAELLIPVTPHFLWRPRLRDPDDEMVLDAAINGGVDAIITFNRKDFLPGAKQFAVEILTPAQALRRIYGQNE